MFSRDFLFDQVPVELAKKIAVEEWNATHKNSLPCVVCGKLVEIDRCKTDENGKAVHEQCYLRRTAGAKGARRIRE